MSGYAIAPLPRPPGVSSAWAADINSVGQIVGSYLGGGEQSYIFDMNSEEFTFIDYPSAYSTVATGVNDLGQVVGYYRNAEDDISTQHAFKYHDGIYERIGSGAARDINNSGQILLSDVWTGRNGYLESDGTFFPVEYPSGGTLLSGINDSGTIVGTYYSENAINTKLTFTYDIASNTYTDLSSDISDFYPAVINNEGEIFGRSLPLSGKLGAVVYDNGIPRPVAPLGFSVRGTNNIGQIVGSATDDLGRNVGFIGVFDETLPDEPQSTLPVAAGGTATISTEFLLSTDNLSGPAGLTYTVVTAPTYGTLLRDGVATHMFTQADIDSGRVGYRHDGDAATKDVFAFTVADQAGNWIGPEPFTVAIVDTTDPVVFENEAATVSAGGTLLIWKDALSTVALGSDPGEMRYNIVAGPAYGTLLLDGRPTVSFTQADIDNGLFEYLQNGDAAAGDSFTFTVTDRSGTQTAAQTFHIDIEDAAAPTADAISGARIVLGGAGPEWNFSGGFILENGNFGYLLRNTGDAIGGALVVGEVMDGEAVYTRIGGIAPEWELVGTGDFSGNGQSDFLMRNTGEAIGGSLVVGEVVATMLTFTDIGDVDKTFQFVGIGNYAGGAETDFLMRDGGSGAVMVGSVANGTTTFTSLGPEHLQI